MTKDWDRYWWEWITGPHSLAEDVQDALSGGRSAVIHVPSDLPWRQTMRSVIEGLCRDRSEAAEIMFESVDIRDEYSGRYSDPGRFLLERRRNDGTYRAGSGQTVQDYLVKTGVLRDTVMWLKGFVKCEDAAAWADFCADFRSPGTSGGLFVLEMPESFKTKTSKNIKTVSYRSRISRHDLRLFCCNVLDGISKDADREWGQYAAALAARLCDTDAEIALELMSACDIKKDDPRVALAKIADDFDRRGGEDGSSHILAIVRDGDEQEIASRIWAAQVETFMPLIELQRMEIITRFYEAMMNLISSSAPLVQNFEEISDPYDMEIGTIYYHRDRIIGDHRAREQVFYLREARNMLAHRKCLDSELIERVLSPFR